MEQKLLLMHLRILWMIITTTTLIKFLEANTGDFMSQISAYLYYLSSPLLWQQLQPLFLDPIKLISNMLWKLYLAVNPSHLAFRINYQDDRWSSLLVSGSSHILISRSKKAHSAQC